VHILLCDTHLSSKEKTDRLQQPLANTTSDLRENTHTIGQLVYIWYGREERIDSQTLHKETVISTSSLW